jgi:hypothetical protein
LVVPFVETLARAVLRFVVRHIRRPPQTAFREQIGWPNRAPRQSMPPSDCLFDTGRLVILRYSSEP